MEAEGQWVYSKIGKTEVRGRRVPSGIDIEQVSPVYDKADFGKAVKAIEEKLERRFVMEAKRTPSPWPGRESGGRDLTAEEYAFSWDSMPVNSIPFITRLREVLDEAKTNSLDSVSKIGEASLKARALLWILNTQYFGQIATIDMTEEWRMLDRALKNKEF